MPSDFFFLKSTKHLLSRIRLGILEQNRFTSQKSRGRGVVAHSIGGTYPFVGDRHDNQEL
jgi:hypothetical protein